MKNVVLIISFISIISITKAQTVSNSTVNSAGNSNSYLNITYEWSVGEMVLVETMINAENIITNGFLQPLKIVPLEILTDFGINPNNILTANGDGQNDTWVIDFLEQYPENEVSIFDRSGRRIFYAKNYTNNWDGKLDGIALHEDTYYYVIRITRDGQTGIKKGYVTLLNNL